MLSPPAIFPSRQLPAIDIRHISRRRKAGEAPNARERMKAPASAKKDTHRQGAPVARRSRFGIDRFHRTPPPPCKANPPKATQ
ncbi:unnamed protein product [Klebsiella pneumoniae]|nr:hypothetical protein DR88_5221 [Klebsiella pneumoniae]CDQ52068.1 unnamed protein product [Klebsiella pneumoniae]